LVRAIATCDCAFEVFVRGTVSAPGVVVRATGMRIVVVDVS
jgi:hypothetical protein